MWRHKSKYKGQKFWGTYEFTRAGKRMLRFKNINTGREVGKYTSHEAAKADGWKRGA